jgi:hypothetical protein
MASSSPYSIKIFISYSHFDHEWLERLQVHLKPLQRAWKVDVWDDTRVQPGQEWKQEIQRAIEAAKIAILLISADFLASEFIATQELPSLLSAAEAKGTVIMPVILSKCSSESLDALSKFRTVNHDSGPLAGRPRHKKEEFWAQLTDMIVETLKHSGPPRRSRGSPGQVEAGALSSCDRDARSRDGNRLKEARVLLVENDGFWQEFLQKQVCEALPGSDPPLIAERFQDGVTKLWEGGWDLVVTDIGLPPDGGIELGMLLVRLAKTEQVPCIVVSGTVPLTDQHVEELLGEWYRARRFFGKDDLTDSPELQYEFQDLIREIVAGSRRRSHGRRKSPARRG